MQKGLKMTKQRIRQRLRRSGRASKVRAPEPAEDIRFPDKKIHYHSECRIKIVANEMCIA